MNTQEREWDTIWSRENTLQKIVSWGRSIYNFFLIRLIRKYVSNQSTILELGCGTSSPSLRIAKKIRSFTGLDFSDEALKISATNAAALGITNATFVKGDCRNVPYENEFDFTWSQGLIEHFENPHDVAFQHFKTIKPGGTVLISVPYRYSYHKIWYAITRPNILRRFWPWTDQVFLDRQSLLAIGKSITPRSRIFFLRPFILGLIILEMRK